MVKTLTWLLLMVHFWLTCNFARGQAVLGCIKVRVNQKRQDDRLIDNKLKAYIESIWMTIMSFSSSILQMLPIVWKQLMKDTYYAAGLFCRYFFSTNLFRDLLKCFVWRFLPCSLYNFKAAVQLQIESTVFFWLISYFWPKLCWKNVCQGQTFSIDETSQINSKSKVHLAHWELHCIW